MASVAALHTQMQRPDRRLMPQPDLLRRLLLEIPLLRRLNLDRFEPGEHLAHEALDLPFLVVPPAKPLARVPQSLDMSVYDGEQSSIVCGVVHVEVVVVFAVNDQLQDIFVHLEGLF